MKKIDWIIHAMANGVCCSKNNKVENSFIDGACNFHTHGMEKYGHLDFQVVLELDPNDIAFILNTLGMRVQSGEKLNAGDLVYGIFEDCPIRLDEFEETGRTVLRVIIPDEKNIFPDEEVCNDDFKFQLLPSDALYRVNDTILS